MLLPLPFAPAKINIRFIEKYYTINSVLLHLATGVSKLDNALKYHLKFPVAVPFTNQNSGSDRKLKSLPTLSFGHATIEDRFIEFAIEYRPRSVPS